MNIGIELVGEENLKGFGQLLREAPLPLACITKVVVCLSVVCLFVTVLGSIPGRLSQWGHAFAYGSFDAKIVNLLFWTKNEPLSNRLADK